MSLLQELQRRNVVKVAVLYVVAAWLILQAAELLFDAMNVPGEWLRFLIAMLVLGMPLVLIFSWVFEITPEGVKREKDIDRSESITPQTGRRINTLIVVLLLVAVATIAVDRLVPEKAVESLPVVAAVEAVTAENSIAVLPFTDLSAEGDQEYFSDGIAEEILNVLVRIEGLQVASRTTSFGFKGQESLGIPVIAERLRVRHVLEGSVRKSGDTVRITAQLIDAQSDKHLWSETYDRQLSAESIFEIQDEIAAAIVGQLGAFMSSDGGRSAVVADTQNLEAYELYLQAHKLFIERANESQVERSIALFEKAVAVDPAFARARVGLAAAYVVAPSWGITGRDYYELAKTAANTAIGLDPNLPLSYAVLGYELSVRLPPEFEATLANYDKALELNRKEATVLLWRGSALLDLGYFDRAERDFTRCLQIDPAYENCRGWLTTVKVFAGEFDAAKKLFEQGLLNGYIENGASMSFLLLAQGNSIGALISTAMWNRDAGTAELIEPVFNAMSARDFEFENRRASIEALHKAVLGDELVWGADEFFTFYFKNYDAIRKYPDSSFWWYPYPEDFKQSPHPKRMIRDFGIFDYWRKHGFPPQCRPIGGDDFECD